MACPSGCTNGGGQIKLKDVNLKLQQEEKAALADNQTLVQNIEELLSSMTSRSLLDKESSQQHQETIDRLVYEVANLSLDDPSTRWFECQFKAVQKEQQNAFNIKW